MIRRWIAYVAALSLAITASALWDFVFKPVFVLVFELIVRFGTLGVSSIRDGIYVEIALRGQNYSAYIANVVIALIIVSCMHVFGLWGRIRRKLQNKPLRPIVKDPTPLRVTIMQSVVVSVCVFMIMMYARQVYVAGASDTLRVMQAMAAPYIQEHDRLVLASRVARIRSRNDFISVTNDMNAIIEKNGFPRLELFIL
jgi:fumarate reductase subunit D